jgi:hypothetical protein
MSKRLIFLFLILTLGLASAKTFTISLRQPAVLAGTELKAGDYRLDLQDTKLVVKASGKQVLESTVKVENSESKFDATSVRYGMIDGKYTVQEIRVGGTNLKLVFN